MNELEQLRQEAEHLKNAIREGRKAACDTSLAQVKEKSLSNVICKKLPNHQFFLSNHYPYKQHLCATHMSMLYSHCCYQCQLGRL